MLSRIFKDDTFQFGAGNISGYIACLLAVLSFLGVLAFHFPQYLTTPNCGRPMMWSFCAS
ncbi:hypothetical protein [Aliamphritea spongicola]|nr:hypothetical protein [Aliamphritea spongicola]